MSSTLADLVTFVGNVVLNRLNSIVDYVGEDNITEVVNALLANIPDEIKLGNFTLQGGISDSVMSINNNYASLPLDVSFMYGDNQLDQTNLANFRDAIS